MLALRSPLLKIGVQNIKPNVFMKKPQFIAAVFFYVRGSVFLKTVHDFMAAIFCFKQKARWLVQRVF